MPIPGGPLNGSSRGHTAGQTRSPAVWDSEIVPMLQAIPGLRPVTILGEMLRRHPGFPADARRTLERRVRLWQALHGTDGR